MQPRLDKTYPPTGTLRKERFHIVGSRDVRNAPQNRGPIMHVQTRRLDEEPSKRRKKEEENQEMEMTVGDASEIDGCRA